MLLNAALNVGNVENDTAAAAKAADYFTQAADVLKRAAQVSDAREDWREAGKLFESLKFRVRDAITCYEKAGDENRLAGVMVG